MYVFYKSQHEKASACVIQDCTLAWRSSAASPFVGCDRLKLDGPKQGILATSENDVYPPLRSFCINPARNGTGKLRLYDHQGDSNDKTDMKGALSTTSHE